MLAILTEFPKHNKSKEISSKKTIKAMEYGIIIETNVRFPALHVFFDNILPPKENSSLTALQC